MAFGRSSAWSHSCSVDFHLFPGHWTVLPSDTKLPETVWLSTALFNALGLFSFPSHLPTWLSVFSALFSLIQSAVQVLMKEGGGGWVVGWHGVQDASVSNLLLRWCGMFLFLPGRRGKCQIEISMHMQYFYLKWKREYIIMWRSLVNNIKAV